MSPAADGITTDLDVLEEDVFSRTPSSSGRMQRIYQLKRGVGGSSSARSALATADAT
jgi:hypothetical protein